MYKAQNIDTDKALAAIEHSRKIQREKIETEIKEKEAYLKGVQMGLDIAESLFTCCNYEKKVSENNA